jgi:hypothetical protein
VSIILAAVLVAAIFAGTDVVPRRAEHRTGVIRATLLARAGVAHATPRRTSRSPRSPCGGRRDRRRSSAHDGARPRSTPGEPPPAIERIDVPLRFDATGRRVT